jgi:transposase
VKTYRAWSPGQSFLLPPSPLEWLPEGHLAYFVLELVETIDLSAINGAIQQKDARGERPYPPALMVALLLYGYATGVFSSRKIAQATHVDVAFRVIAGGTHPHFTTINEFRSAYRGEVSKLFLHVLQLCRAAGLVSLGHISVDGTKVNANASKHKAMSYERMQAEEKRLTGEIDELLKRAEEADHQEDVLYGIGHDAEVLPEELRMKEARLERIRRAKAALEQEAAVGRAEHLRELATGMREKANDESVPPKQRREALTRAEKSEAAANEMTKGDSNDNDGDGAGGAPDVPKNRPPANPDGTPKPKAQRNFTDPDSRIMMRDGAVIQGFNAQAAVDSESQVIVAELVTNQAPDQQHLIPVVEMAIANTGRPPDILTADSGYLSRTAIEWCESWGIDGYIAVGREAGTAVNPPGTGKDTAAQRARAGMAEKLKAPSGKAIYARRKTVAEPPFGQIKEARRFRRFSVRGLAKVRTEWTLVCLTHNLLKLFRRVGSLEVLAMQLAT